MVLSSASSRERLGLRWNPVESPHPLTYQVQYRVANSNQDYQEEQLWSTYSLPTLCRWEELGEGPEEKAEGEAVSREGRERRASLAGRLVCSSLLCSHSALL